MKPTIPTKQTDGSTQVTKRIEDLGDWRGTTLAKVRNLIHEADPEIEEECKWIKPSNPSGVPVWSHGGMICTGETHQRAVKLTFARGASIDDPKKLFNAGLDGNVRRAIDIHEGEMPDGAAFKQLIRSAVEANLSTRSKKSAKNG